MRANASQALRTDLSMVGTSAVTSSSTATALGCSDQSPPCRRPHHRGTWAGERGGRRPRLGTRPGRGRDRTRDPCPGCASNHHLFSGELTPRLEMVLGLDFHGRSLVHRFGSTRSTDIFLFLLRMGKLYYLEIEPRNIVSCKATNREKDPRNTLQQNVFQITCPSSNFPGWAMKSVAIFAF